MCFSLSWHPHAVLEMQILLGRRVCTTLPSSERGEWSVHTWKQLSSEVHAGPGSCGNGVLLSSSFLHDHLSSNRDTSYSTILCMPLGLLMKQNIRMQSAFPQAKFICVESGLQDLSLVHDLQIMHTREGREGPLLSVVTRRPCWLEENLQGHVL